MPSNRLTRWLLGTGMALVLSAALSACLGGGAGSPTPKPGLAPDFGLNDLNGQRVTLSQYRGKPVMLNFWASWCGPCRIEIPEVQALHEAHPGNDVIILAVNFGEPAATVGERRQRGQAPWRNPTERQGKRIWYAGGIGTDLRIADVILERAREAERDWDGAEIPVEG